MNTRKQVLVMAVLLFSTMIILGIYAAWYPTRAFNAEIEFDEKSAWRGSIIFSQNCRLCHGDMGEGGAAGARLPAAPALNRLTLQGFVETEITLAENVTARADSIRVSNASRIQPDQVILLGDERMRVMGVSGTTVRVRRGWDHTTPTSHFSGAEVMIQDPDRLKDQMTLLTNTIVCGRVGTSMPAWGQAHGGPLNDEQVRQLVVLITKNRWHLVGEENEHADATGVRLLSPASATTISLHVGDVRPLSADEVIRLGTERIRVDAVPTVAQNERDPSGILQVTRGVLQSAPQEHAEGTEVYRFPLAPDQPTFLVTSCGQTARPQAPVGTPSLIESFEGQTVEIVAQNIAFNLREIRVKAGGQVRLRLDNRDAGVDHNIAVRRSATDPTPVHAEAIGLIFRGPGIDDTAFPVPAPGTYFFVCDVHPTTMTGSFIVEP